MCEWGRAMGPRAVGPRSVSEEQQNIRIHTRLEDSSKEQKFFPASLAVGKEMLSLQGVFHKNHPEYRT